MTDELSIQQQPRQIGSYALPGAVLGAASGSAAGWAINKYALQKPMSHEDIVKEVNDKDKFEARVKDGAPEAASWKDVQEKGNALKAAEDELKTASEPVLEENSELMKKLNAAQEGYDKALEEAKNKVSGDKVKTKAHSWAELTIDPKDPKYNIDGLTDANEITKRNRELAEALRKKGVRSSSKKGLAERYRNACEDLVNARNNVDSVLTTIKNNKNTTVIEYDKALMSKMGITTSPTGTLEKLSDSTFKIVYDQFNKKPSKALRILGKKSPAQSAAIELAERELPDIATTSTSYTESVLKELGATEGMAPKGGNYVKLTAQRLNPKNGEIAEVEYYMEKGKFNKAVSKYNKNIEALREKRAGQILTGFRTRIQAAVENRKNNVISKIQANFSKAEIDALLNEGFLTRDASGILNGYDLTRTSTSTDKTFEKALKRLKRFDKNEGKKYQEGLLNLYSGVPAFESFDKQISEAYTKNKELAEANKAIEENFKGVVKDGASLLEEAAETTLSDEEIAKKAEGMVSDKKKLVDDLSKQVEEAKKSSGKVDEAAKKAAEEKVESAKKAFEEATKSLGEKFKKGGAKPWVATAIGAAALGLIGLGLGSSSKKYAQEEIA